MPDITAELYSIKTKSLGDNVLGAIYDALLKIDNYIGPVELDEEVERTADSGTDSVSDGRLLVLCVGVRRSI